MPRLMNYAAAALMDMLIGCSALGLTLLGAVPDSPFNVPDFNFRFALLMSVGGLGTALGSIYLSRLSDRFGRRPIILIGLFGVIGSCLLYAVSNRWWHLFAITVGRSAFMGMFWPSLEARITDGAEGREMTRRLGWFGISFCSGLLLGYPVSGLLHDASPRTPFFVGAGIGALLWVMLHQTFRRDTTHDGHVLGEGETDDLNAQRLPPAPLRRAFLVSAWVANALSYAGASVLRNLFPRFARLSAPDGLGFSGFEAGLIAGGSSAAMLLAFVFFGGYHFWHYRYRYLIGGQMAMLAGAVIFAVASPMSVLLAGSLLFGTGAGVVYMSSIYYSLEGHAKRAGQSGLHEGILCFGWSGGMLIVALISRLVTAARTPYWVCAALLAAGMLIQAAIYSAAKRRAGETDERRQARSEPA
ncbi:MAG: MFS transporter [Planctomycetota bacterium]